MIGCVQMEIFLLINIKEHLAEIVLLTKNQEEESFYKDILFSYKYRNKIQAKRPTGSGTAEMDGEELLPNPVSKGCYRVTAAFKMCENRTRVAFVIVSLYVFQ